MSCGWPTPARRERFMPRSTGRPAQLVSCTSGPTGSPLTQRRTWSARMRVYGYRLRVEWVSVEARDALQAAWGGAGPDLADPNSVTWLTPDSPPGSLGL